MNFFARLRERFLGQPEKIKRGSAIKRRLLLTKARLKTYNIRHGRLRCDANSGPAKEKTSLPPIYSDSGGGIGHHRRHFSGAFFTSSSATLWFQCFRG